VHNLVKEYDTYRSIQSYAKIYPDFVKVYKYDRPVLVKQSGFERVRLICNEFSGYKFFEVGSYLPLSLKVNDRVVNPEESLIRSLRRSKTTISDLVLCNEFDMFATFTFDPKKVDRTSPDLVKAKMSKWLNNQQRIHGAFRYLIVSEFHKKCGACADAHAKSCPHDDVIKPIHFHALLSDFKSPLIDSKRRINGRKCYNIKSFKLGHSTLVKIDDRQKVSSYVRKYIVKDMPQFQSKKRYWCSTGLLRPMVLTDPGFLENPFIICNEVWQTNCLTVYRADVKFTIQTKPQELLKCPQQKTSLNISTTQLLRQKSVPKPKTPILLSSSYCQKTLF